jgi:multidrug efflux pump subunit AcrA (membrane-fusion protein)
MNPRDSSTIAAAAAVIVGAGLALSPEAPAAEPPATAPALVTVVRAVNACFSAVVRATGFVVPREEAMVTLTVPGFKIVEVLAGEGDRVTSGQVLVRLTRQAGEGQDAPAAAGNAAPAAGTAATLKSPAAGVVTQSTAVVGAVASPMPTEPLFRIAVRNEIELEVEVSSFHVTELSLGQMARIELEDGRSLIGRVRLAPAEVDQRTQLGRARLSLEADSSLRIGTFARAVISANRSCGVSVPTSAVQFRTGGTRVQVVNDATIQTRTVQVGLHSDTDSEIRDGLREGDIVVANAGTSLRDGDKVTPIFADGTAVGQR